MASELFVPFMILLVLGVAAWKRIPAYDLFVQGAREGMATAVQLLPNLAAMLCAVELMQVSGLMNALCRACAPLLQKVGLPEEIAPLILLRPLSGSASLAMLERLLDQFGADSRIGLIASTIMGSGETILYTICVYMSGCEKKDAGYALYCSLAGNAAGIWFAGMLI